MIITNFRINRTITELNAKWRLNPFFSRPDIFVQYIIYLKRTNGEQIKYIYNQPFNTLDVTCNIDVTYLIYSIDVVILFKKMDNQQYIQTIYNYEKSSSYSTSMSTSSTTILPSLVSITPSSSLTMLTVKWNLVPYYMSYTFKLSCDSKSTVYYNYTLSEQEQTDFSLNQISQLSINIENSVDKIYLWNNNLYTVSVAILYDSTTNTTSDYSTSLQKKLNHPQIPYSVYCTSDAEDIFFNWLYEKTLTNDMVNNVGIPVPDYDYSNSSLTDWKIYIDGEIYATIEKESPNAENNYYRYNFDHINKGNWPGGIEHIYEVRAKNESEMVGASYLFPFTPIYAPDKPDDLYEDGYIITARYVTNDFIETYNGAYPHTFIFWLELEEYGIWFTITKDYEVPAIAPAIDDTTGYYATLLFADIDELEFLATDLHLRICVRASNKINTIDAVACGGTSDFKYLDFKI